MVLHRREWSLKLQTTLGSSIQVVLEKIVWTLRFETCCMDEFHRCSSAALACFDRGCEEHSIIAQNHHTFSSLRRYPVLFAVSVASLCGRSRRRGGGGTDSNSNTSTPTKLEAENQTTAYYYPANHDALDFVFFESRNNNARDFDVPSVRSLGQLEIPKDTVRRLLLLLLF